MARLPMLLLTLSTAIDCGLTAYTVHEFGLVAGTALVGIVRIASTASYAGAVGEEEWYFARRGCPQLILCAELFRRQSGDRREAIRAARWFRFEDEQILGHVARLKKAERPDDSIDEQYPILPRA